MNKETQDLIAWAENYKPTIKRFRLNKYIYVEDLEKSLSTLAARTKLIDNVPVFIAYRDHLKEIKEYLDKNDKAENIP